MDGGSYEGSEYGALLHCGQAGDGTIKLPSATGDLPRLGTAPRSIQAEGGERWYLVYTQPHREIRAEGQLQAQGFKAFLPRYRKTIRHARKLISVNAAFFPRYLFVALDLDRDRWRSVNGTFGVTSLVMGEATRPRPVPNGIVEALIQASDEAGHVQLGNSLDVGDRVRVISGPFANLFGDLVRVDGARRVRVLLQLLNGAVAVSFDRSDLALASAA